MATTVYNDPWSPSNINCNWKPEKLSRYSFVENKIDFNAAGVELGHSQTGSYPVENSETNLTDYIEVNQLTYYSFKAEEGVLRGVRYVAYFNSNKAFLSYGLFPSQVTLAVDFRTPVNCAYAKLTIYKEAWEKCTLMLSSGYSFSDKGTTPLNIVDNIEGKQIYKDLHFEVFVKAEAVVKNFINCFNLSAFSDEANPRFQCYTPDYYKEKYPSSGAFQANHAYNVGDVITVYNYFSMDYICITAHTSADTFENDYYVNPGTSDYSTKNWMNIDYIKSSGDWLYINKNIKESNYDAQGGFPYIADLVFKNLWGCDMLNYLNVFVKKSNLCITYNSLFAKNLRKANYSYNKYFELGYFLDNDSEDFGATLIMGENFQSDELLGENKLNNYLTFGKYTHPVPSDWNASNDSVVINNFGGMVYNPFDHYYKFEPKVGMPFFKEKVFEDSLIEFVLQKEDKLGNIYKRIVELPILITFTNNLIKGYFTNGHTDSLSKIYTSEYLNSNYDHWFTAKAADDTYIVCRTRIWCPNSERLSLSSTIIGPCNVRQRPELRSHNGQTCNIYWEFDSGAWANGVVMRAVHILEYSDGENYDKFIYIENIELKA